MESQGDGFSQSVQLGAGNIDGTDMDLPLTWIPPPPVHASAPGDGCWTEKKAQKPKGGIGSRPFALVLAETRNRFRPP